MPLFEYIKTLLHQVNHCRRYLRRMSVIASGVHRIEKHNRIGIRAVKHHMSAMIFSTGVARGTNLISVPFGVFIASMIIPSNIRPDCGYVPTLVTLVLMTEYAAGTSHSVTHRFHHISVQVHGRILCTSRNKDSGPRYHWLRGPSIHLSRMPSPSTLNCDN